jgi:hypothetical protein
MSTNDRHEEPAWFPWSVTVDLGGEWDFKLHTIKQCLGLGLRTLGGRQGAEMPQPGSIAKIDVGRRVFGCQSCAGPCCNGWAVPNVLPLARWGNQRVSVVRSARLLAVPSFLINLLLLKLI